MKHATQQYKRNAAATTPAIGEWLVVLLVREVRRRAVNSNKAIQVRGCEEKSTASGALRSAAS